MGLGVFPYQYDYESGYSNCTHVSPGKREGYVSAVQLLWTDLQTLSGSLGNATPV